MLVSGFILDSYELTMRQLPLSEYVCPKCGHFNQSSRSKKERMQSPSESTTSPPSLSPGLNAQALSPGIATSDMPTVDGDDTMSMEVDAIQSKDTSAP